MTSPLVPPYAIGSPVWPGLAKLVEELGELSQVAGKIMAYPDGEHPDGNGPLEPRLEDELADVIAAASFVLRANEPRLNRARTVQRIAAKVERFDAWAEQEARR